MVRRGWLVGMFVSLVLFVCPSVALADDGSLLDSFGNGFQSLVGDPEMSENDGLDAVRDYEPVLAAPPESTAIEIEEGKEIQAVVGAVNVNPMISGGNFGDDLLGGVRTFFIRTVQTQFFLIPAISLVFFWWGVRKSVRMLMSAWKRGKESV